MRRRYIVFFLLLIPAFIFRDYTPTNELKYISIAEEALTHGHYFTFYDHGEIYADKPPLYLWIVMLMQSIFGYVSPFMMSFFSIIPALVILFIMDKWTRNSLDKAERVSAASMLMTTCFFLGTALTVRMDMLMSMFIVLSLYSFYSLYTGAHHGAKKWLLPIFIFMAVFSKGPVGLIMPVVSIIIFLVSKKETRLIKDYLGIRQVGMIILLLGIWFAAVYAEGGETYLHNLLFKQTVGRSVNSFIHKHPFYYYLETMWYTFAPWIFFYVVSIYFIIKKQLIKTDFQRLFLIIVGSTFIIMSMVSSKMEIYLLPVYPFVTYLCISVIKEIKSSKWIKATIIFPAAIITLTLPAYFIFGSKIIPNELIGDYKIIAAIACLSIGSAIALIELIRYNRLFSAIQSLSYGLLAMIFIASFSLSKINHDIGYKDLAKEADKLATEKGETYYCYKSQKMGYLDVYTKHPVDKISELKELEKLAAKQSFLLIVSDKKIQKEQDLKLYTSNMKRYSVGEFEIIMVNKNANQLIR